MLFCAAIVFSSCGSDDEDALGGVDPDKNVADPVGTITLSMRDTKNGNTYLDNIQIENENFTGWECYFASIGAVKGLGNVANIPTTGWASQVAVIPGNGYVAYNNSRFYRLYVTDYITATSGGIIGADVKYQKPFKGKDEAISLDVETVTIPAEGGTQTLVFKNQGLIIFDVTSKRFQVEKASTNDYSFLADGIAITAQPNNATSAIEDSITLTTAYGKKTTLKVIQAGATPFLELQESLNLTADQQIQTVELSGNVTFSNLSASSSATWCKAKLVDNTAYMQAKSKKVKFIGDQPVNTSRESSSVASSYSLQLTVDENTSSQSREAIIIVKSKDGKASASLKVVQNKLNILLGKSQVVFPAIAQQKSVYISVSSNEIEKIKLESSTDWCSANFESSNSIQISCEENPSEQSRDAIVSLLSSTGESLAQLRIVQNGVSFELTKVVEVFDRYASSRTITINTSVEEWEVDSSEPWCTLSKSGNKLTIRVTASAEDRTAIISFKEFNANITVHQRKYALGDNYKEQGLDGIVGYIGDDYGLIYKNLGQAAWSLENVLTGASSDFYGELNMDIIKKRPNWETNYPAFKLCDDLNQNGVSGWYLPASVELWNLYGIDEIVWSSSEYKSYEAQIRNSNFSVGRKDQKYYVYAVHKF